MIVCPFCNAPIIFDDPDTGATHARSTYVPPTVVSVRHCDATECVAQAKALTPESEVVREALSESNKIKVRSNRK